MTWDITNNNYDDLHIKVTNGWATYYLPKFRIYMVVEEPYLTIYWTDSEKGQMNDTRSLVLDYNDVSSTPASATALKADIEAMELSGFNVFNWPVSTKTADYPLVLADAWTVIEGNTTGSVKITVPLNATQAFPVGTEIIITSRDTGSVYLEATGGVTIYAVNDYLKVLPSGGVAKLIKTATDSWYFTGDITINYDSDAAAFFAAVVSAGGTFTDLEKEYMNTFFLALKATGSLWTKTHFCHLYVGGTDASVKLNIKNPLNTDAAFRLTFIGSPTINANGVTTNGSSQYINTYYNPSVNASQNDKAYAVYFRSVGTAANWGAINGSFQGDALIIDTAGANYWQASAELNFIWTPVIKPGFYLINRTTSTLADYRRNDVSLATDVAASVVNINLPIFIGCRNLNGSPNAYSADNICFDWGGASLTSGEATALYNACIALQTSLGR